MDKVSLIRETKNKLLFKKLIKESWGLSYKGYKLFRQRLLYDRPIAKEYKEIIGDSPDLRRRIPLTGENNLKNALKEEDKGFKIFYTAFREFKVMNEISYDDFSRGKYYDKKNEVKIYKGMRNYYFKLVDDIYNKEEKKFHIHDNNSNSRLYELLEFFSNTINTLTHFLCVNEDAQSMTRSIEKIQNIVNKINPEEEDFYLRAPSVDPMLCRVKGGKILISLSASKRKSALFSSDDQLKELVDLIIKELSEFIGKHKIPSNRELELVISLNPVDWFLCSTREKWSSCLNLEGGYMFWPGLPTLIGDKNRALVYITDGRKKEFLGMEVDKFLTRSWLVTAREKTSKKLKRRRNETYFNLVREYPTRYGLDNILKRHFDLKYIHERRGEDKKFIGKYYIEAVHFRTKSCSAFLTPYLDHCEVKPAKKNKAKYKPGEFFRYKFGNGGIGFFPVTEKTPIARTNFTLHEEASDVFEYLGREYSPNAKSGSGIFKVLNNGLKVSDFIEAH